MTLPTTAAVSNTLHLAIANNEGVLERVLRIVRHRGFALRGLAVAPRAGNAQVDVVLQVESERPINLLSCQLAKLEDVLSVLTATPPVDLGRSI